MILLFVLGLLLYVIATSLIIYTMIKDEENEYSELRAVIYICLIAALCLLMFSVGRLGYRASNYEVRTEIKVKMVNNQEVSRDTIYKFILK